MSAHMTRLRAHHRRLDRLIDTTKNLGRQEELKGLKRMRLKLKDRIAKLQSGTENRMVPAT